MGEGGGYEGKGGYQDCILSNKAGTEIEVENLGLLIIFPSLASKPGDLEGRNLIQ